MPFEGCKKISEDRQLNKNAIDQLKKLILRSGFPLQIEISSILIKHFKAIDELTDISTSAYYMDKDDGKGRELDVKVDIPIGPKKRKEWPMIFLNLLIQCKNIPGNAWVFFKSPYKVESTCKSTSVLDAIKWIPRTHVDFTYPRDLHLRKLLITNVYHEFVLDKNKSNKRNDNLFEAVISLAKATSYEYETSVKGFRSMLEVLSKEELPDIIYAQIFYSAVVFNGKMYLAEEVEKGAEMSLTPVDHVGLLVDYISGNYNIELTVDIIHKRAFERFMKLLVNDMEILQNALDGETGRDFNRELRKALRWHMSKRDFS